MVMDSQWEREDTLGDLFVTVSVSRTDATLADEQLKVVRRDWRWIVR